MMDTRLFKLAALLAGLCCTAQAQAGDGLRPSGILADQTGAGLPGWSARWYTPPATPLQTHTSTEESSLMSSWGVLGDYHFAAAPGLRATGGVFGLGRSISTGLVSPGTRRDGGTQLPYMGLGYSGHWPQAGLQGLGWSVNAEFGLLALNPRSAVRLGQMTGPSSLDSTERDMRFAPLMQIGVSYGF